LRKRFAAARLVLILGMGMLLDGVRRFEVRPRFLTDLAATPRATLSVLPRSVHDPSWWVEPAIIRRDGGICQPCDLASVKLPLPSGERVGVRGRPGLSTWPPSTPFRHWSELEASKAAASTRPSPCPLPGGERERLASTRGFRQEKSGPQAAFSITASSWGRSS